MNGSTMVRLVAGREIRHRLRSRSFFVFTAILCVGILGVGVLNRVLSGDDEPTHYDVVSIGSSLEGFDRSVESIATSFGVEVKASDGLARSAAEAAVKDGSADAAIDAASGELITRSGAPDALANSIDVAWRSASAASAARDAGLDESQIESVLSPEPLRSNEIDPDDDDGALGAIVGTASGILLFLSISSFGGYVLTGVVEEKSTGVVEVLLSQVKAHQLLAGKVFGIGVVAMVQFAAAVVAGLGSLLISGADVPTNIWVGLPITVVWFIGGFVLYSTLFALAGSFVSRQEDAQGAAAPISLVLLAAYITVFALGTVPGSLASRVLSVLPPFAPLLMPLRIATGAASILEIVTALVLLFAAIYGMLRLAGAVYARTLLHRGSRLKWGEVLSSLRSPS